VQHNCKTSVISLAKRWSMSNRGQFR